MYKLLIILMLLGFISCTRLFEERTVIETTPLEGYELTLEIRSTVHGSSDYVYVLKRKLPGGRLSKKLVQREVDKDSLSNCVVSLELDDRSVMINKCLKTMEEIPK